MKVIKIEIIMEEGSKDTKHFVKEVLPELKESHEMKQVSVQNHIDYWQE